jgi:hypothetical protein
MRLIDHVSEARRSGLRAVLDQLTISEVASLTKAFARFAEAAGEPLDREWRGIADLVVLSDPPDRGK